MKTKEEQRMYDAARSEKKRLYYIEHREERQAYERSRREEHNAANRKWTKINGWKRRAFWKASGEEFVQMKGEVGCEKCGTHDGVAIDFHHVSRNDKQFTIVLKEYMYRPLEELMNEIAKCQTLCSNCHRRIEWNKRHPGASDFPQT